MSKIALKMVEEMQLSWEYGQTFHPYSTLKGKGFYEIDCMKQAGAGKHSSYVLELHQNKILLNQCSPRSNHKIKTTNECFSTDNMQNSTKRI